MTPTSTQEIADKFAQKIAERLDPARLDGPVRLDNTRTVVIIPLRGRDAIHAHVRLGIDDEGAADVMQQLQSVPGLKGLVREGT